MKRKRKFPRKKRKRKNSTFGARFKYAKTKPIRLGMSTAEILLMDDNDLSFKKIASYWKEQNRCMLKMRAKELLHATSLDKKNFVCFIFNFHMFRTLVHLTLEHLVELIISN